MTVEGLRLEEGHSELCCRLCQVQTNGSAAVLCTQRMNALHLQLQTAEWSCE